MTKPVYYGVRQAAALVNRRSSVVSTWVSRGWLTPDATLAGGGPLFLAATIQAFDRIAPRGKGSHRNWPPRATL